MTPILSIIIPFGLSKERIYIKDRVIQKATHLKSDEKVEYIFVEGYSSFENNLKQIIEENGHIYLKDESQKDFFSQGKCRNLGACFANAQVIMFLDVDCYISLFSLEKILNLIKIKNIAQCINEFLVLPVVYLTKEGSYKIYKEEEKLWDDIIKDDLIGGKRKLIKYFSLISSSIILNKYKFLVLGGNNCNFIGHSYEDHDFFARLLFNTTKFLKTPKALCYDEGSWNIRKFKGFRAWFSLLGYETSFHGIYMFHFYHEEPNQNNYMSNRHKNHKKFYKNLANLKNYQIKPLIDKKANDCNILLVCNKTKFLLSAINRVIPFLGHMINKNENIFFNNDVFNENKFLFFLKENKISKVLFANPYANDKRLQIYQFVKKYDIKYICFDRGALPDSWFFDSNGFNYDSSSYKEENWNKDLDNEQILETKKYIKEIINENVFLEKQGQKKGIKYFKEKFNLKDKKVVFIPLQVENDTVIRYFTYKPFTYDNFLNIINELAFKLKQTHIFLVKKHPLSLAIKQAKYQNLKFVPNNTNIIDMIELCDAVVTLNSGVGLYAMIMNKPCINCANAFYSFKDLNFKANNEGELYQLLISDLNIDYDKVLKFIWYLKNRFYSYGKSYYKKSFKNGRFYNKVYNIDFYKIIIENKYHLSVKNIDKTVYDLQSLIYTPYKYEIFNKNVFIKLFDILIPDFIKTKISHFRFYRIFKKKLYTYKK
ncbi:capsular biosynthesis protein [Campylobacter molothri]|uniref:capsular polysaccharide export protein, LipB/KpsS family n=1 Tax=Campylobacter molothri TaxID=1032242 RepID=UPI00301CF7AB|nr:capsular biosynthesis protein [Campylobacter sp. RM17709]